MAQLVELEGGLLVTPWHPVWHVSRRVLPSATEKATRLAEVTEGAWTFPCEVPGALVVCRPCEAVFSFVIENVQERASAMMINGVQCVTLGHGLREGKVQHPYFGTDAVLDDLRTTQGWNTGASLLAQSPYPTTFVFREILLSCLSNFRV
jgi:hypothetical protein